MSTYDMLPRGSQVKCWGCDMRHLKEGDEVSNLGMNSYIVLLREGGFVRVDEGVIAKIVEGGTPHYPEEFQVPCIDKWGSLIPSREDLKGTGILGEDYYYERINPN